MLISESAAYIGKEGQSGFSGFIAGNNFFMALEIEDGIDTIQGKEIIEKIKQDLSLLSIQNLASFDQFISQIITKYNLPPSLTLAVGYLKSKVMYLKTIGQGKVYLRRKENLRQIIGQDKSASGYLEPDDLFIFTTQKFISILGSDNELKSAIDSRRPNEIINYLKSLLNEKEDVGVTALLVKYKDDQVEEEGILEVEESRKNNNPWEEFKVKGKNFAETFQSYSQRSGKKKRFLLL